MTRYAGDGRSGQKSNLLPYDNSRLPVLLFGRCNVMEGLFPDRICIFRFFLCIEVGAEANEWL